MAELTLRQTIGQLKLMLQRRKIGANQIGEPGCAQRLKARDDVAALEAAINLLSGLIEPGPKLWKARCGVCGEGWTHEGDHNPYPHGTFCPDCRAKKIMAPGVLNFTRADAE